MVNNSCGYLTELAAIELSRLPISLNESALCGNKFVNELCGKQVIKGRTNLIYKRMTVDKRHLRFSRLFYSRLRLLYSRDGQKPLRGALRGVFLRPRRISGFSLPEVS